MPVSLELNSEQTQCELKFAGHTFTLLAAGALYWHKTKTLIFADLHLEKGSHYAEKGTLIPIYDTVNTLKEMDNLIEQFSPDQVICLGDNIHDSHALSRMRPADRKYLDHLCYKVKKWYWIIGNHEQGMGHLPISGNFYQYNQYPMHNIIFTHEFLSINSPQIIGHFHPKKTICYQGQKVSGKCFVVTPQIVIMPALGSFTGGLEVTSLAFKEILNQQIPQYVLIKNQKLWIF